MNHIAIIPARSGSKGVKNKNMKTFYGISLLGWAILFAKEVGIYSKILVSTDSEDYAKEALKYGAVPLMRKRDLSSDTSRINDVLVDLLKSIEYYESITLIEPTCPVREPQSLVKAMDKFRKNSLNCLVSVCSVPLKYHPRKQFSGSRDLIKIERFTSENIPVVNRQELDLTYVRSGAFYIFQRDSFLQAKDIIHGRVSGHLDNSSIINIDTEEDIMGMRRYELERKPPEWMKRLISVYSK